MIMGCFISVSPPRADSAGTLNAAFLSDEAYIEHDAMHLGSNDNGDDAHDLLANRKNHKDAVDEATSLLVPHPEEFQAQPNYTQLPHSGSSRNNTKTLTTGIEALPIEIEQNQNLETAANHPSIPDTNSQARSKRSSSFRSGSGLSSDCCACFSSSPEGSDIDSDCAIESYETPPTEHDRSGQTQTPEAGTETPGISFAKPAASAMPITFAKSPVKAKKGTSLLALSLSQGQKQKQQRQVKAKGATTRAAPVRTYGHTGSLGRTTARFSGRRQSVQQKHVTFVSGPSPEELRHKGKMAELKVEGRRGAIQVHKDAAVDDAEGMRFLVDWIEEHQHYWI